MRRSALEGAATPLLLIALAAGVNLLALLGGDALRQVATQGTVYAVLAVGLYVFVGNSGVLSFGHMGFAMIGGYVAALLTIPPLIKEANITGAPEFVLGAVAAPVPAVLAAGAIAAIVAVVVGLPLMRVSGLTAGLASFALLMVAFSVAQNLDAVTNGSEGLFSIPISTTQATAVAWLAVAIVIAYAYQRSRFGLLLRTSREDEPAARALGVTPSVQRGIAFALSAFLVGVGGALFAMALGTMSPELAYLDLTLVVLTMLVVGGMRSLSGAVIGAIAVSVVREVLDRAEQGDVLGLVTVPARPGLSLTGLAVVLILILVLRPEGIMGDRELTWPWRRRSPVSSEEDGVAGAGRAPRGSAPGPSVEFAKERGVT